MDLPRGEHEKSRLPAWFLSAALHATLVVMLGFLVSAKPVGIRAEPERRVGVALVSQVPDRVQRTEAPAADSGEATPSPVTEAISESLPALGRFQAPVEMPMLPGLEAPSGSGQVGASRANGFRPLQQRPQVGGGQGQTTLFGVQASGNTFVYVFDRSSSMSSFASRPIRAARAELIASLSQLTSVQRFQIIFYNETPTPFIPFAGQPPQMWFASDDNKSLASAFVSRIAPAGATQHLTALEMALRMQPDAIFFLTDAAEPELTADQLRRVRRRNRGASIHTIEFGVGPDPGRENFLRRLARQNQGQHVYIDVTALASREEAGR